MTKYEELVMKADKHNKEVDDYINITLVEHFGGRTIPMYKWFEAQSLLQKQNFYHKALEICEEFHANGFECKVEGQSDKLCLYK